MSADADFAARKKNLRVGVGLIFAGYLLMLVAASLATYWPEDSVALAVAHSMPIVCSFLLIVSAVQLLLAWRKKADKLGRLALLFFVWAVVSALTAGMMILALDS